MPALNYSLAWDPDSRRFPLQAFGFISPSVPGLSALLRNPPCTLKKRDPLWEQLASFLLRKQLQSCPQKFICELRSLQKLYQPAHLKQVFTEEWESWTGWKSWMNAFSYPRHHTLRLKSFFTKFSVKASYRCKNVNMQATFSFSPSHVCKENTNGHLFLLLSVWELTGKTKKLQRLKNLSSQGTMTLTMKNIGKRSTILIIFPS